MKPGWPAALWRTAIAASVLVLLWGCGRTPKLNAEQQTTVDRFLSKYRSDQELTERDIGPIVAVGDPAVPQLAEAIGKVQPGQPLHRIHSDVDMVDCLARIGTPRAIDGICKILRHKYRGYYGMDRMQAAAALVRLGAADRVSVLQEVISEHEQLVGQQRYPEMYSREVAVLKNAVRMLEAGKGAADTSNFGPGLEYGFLEGPM